MIRRLPHVDHVGIEERPRVDVEDRCSERRDLRRRIDSPCVIGEDVDLGPSDVGAGRPDETGQIACLDEIWVDQGQLPDAQVRELGKDVRTCPPAPDDYHVRATQHLLADLAPQQRLPGRGKIAKIRRLIWRRGGLTQSK